MACKSLGKALNPLGMHGSHLCVASTCECHQATRAHVTTLVFVDFIEPRVCQHPHKATL